MYPKLALEAGGGKHVAQWSRRLDTHHLDPGVILLEWLMQGDGKDVETSLGQAIRPTQEVNGRSITQQSDFHESRSPSLARSAYFGSALSD